MHKPVKPLLLQRKNASLVVKRPVDGVVRHAVSAYVSRSLPAGMSRPELVIHRPAIYTSNRPTIVCERPVVRSNRTVAYQTKAVIMTGHGTYLSEEATQELPTLTSGVSIDKTPESIIIPVLIPFGPAEQHIGVNINIPVYAPFGETEEPVAVSVNTAKPAATAAKKRTSAARKKVAASRTHTRKLTQAVPLRSLPTAPLLPRVSCSDLAGAPLLPVAQKRKMALLLPGHNEELIIATTIRSAIAAGQDKADIYVVDDNSSDQTRRLAVEQLGADHVLTVERSGKAGAVQKAIGYFDLEGRYEWLHVADADSIFSADYFIIYREKLNSEKYAVAVGFVQSLRGNWISTYRALCYTYSQHIFRRIQAKLGMISVFPGPITSFRTDILRQLDFNTSSLTEDFDITLQVHRKRLGGIVFIPRAINYTQDPQNLRDFCKQSMRWYRGFFQGVKAYRIGLHGQRIDMSIGFQLLQIILVVLQLGVLVPWFIISTGNWMIIPVAFCIDFVITSVVTLASAVAIKRWNLIGALPYFYFLRYLEVAMYYWAFVEIMVLKKFSTEMKGWATEGRRYKVHKTALQDTAV